MNLNKLCEKVAIKVLGKTGMLVERMTESCLDDMVKGRLYKVYACSKEHLFVKDTSDHGFSVDPNAFRKAYIIDGN